MIAIILTIHTLIVLGLIVVVLLQRSDGGALGIGGGSGGGFMSGRGAANALTRTTSILAALFFATSLGLAIYSGAGDNDEAVIEELTGQATPEPEAEIAAPSTEDLLQSIGGDTNETGSALPAAEQEILDTLGTATAPASTVDEAPVDPPSSDDTDATDEESDQPDQ